MKIKFLILFQCLFMASGLVYAAEFMSVDEYTEVLTRKKKLFNEIDLAIGIEVATTDFDLEDIEHKVSELKKLKRSNRYCLRTLEKKKSALSQEVSEKKRILGSPKKFKKHVENSDSWCLNPWRSCQVSDSLKSEIQTISKNRDALAGEILEQKLKQKELKIKYSQLQEKQIELSRQHSMLTGLAKMIKQSRDDLLSRETEATSANKEWIYSKIRMDPVITLLGAMSFQKDPVFDPGEEFRLFYTDYQTYASKLNEQLHKRVGRLESVQNLASPTYYQHRFLAKVTQTFGSDTESVNKLMNFYEKLSLQLQWYKVAAAAISSGEVNGDDSMLFGGRELALAALEGAEGVTDEIPILKSIVRVLALAGIHYIHEKQMQDNQKFSSASNTFAHSRVFSYVEAEEIINHLDLRKLAQREDPAELCESLAVLWKQSMMSCERHEKLIKMQFSTKHVSMDSFIDDIQNYQSRYIKVIGERFSQKLTKNSWSRRLYRWRNSLNGVISLETGRS